jgi:hypothetical protein
MPRGQFTAGAAERHVAGCSAIAVVLPGYRTSDIASNSVESGCLKIRACEALYQGALVHRSGEQRRIRERGSQLGPSRGPEMVAKTTRPLPQISRIARTEK